ncbi:MAG: YcxB family protein [Clostridiales bacterium]|nr:YcxB family protein [Clostridiales bacterium]
MKSTYEYYEATMVHDDDTIRLMFKTEYYTYEKIRLLLRYVLAIVLVAAALIGGLPTIPQALCLAFGAWLFVTPDFPSKVRAEGVIEMRHGQKSSVTLTFDGRQIGIGNGASIPYTAVDKLIEDGRFYYIFRDKQTAVMVPKGGVTVGNPETFRAYIEEKTGKQFETNKSLMNMNLKDLIAMVRYELAQKKNRKK